MTDGFKVLRYKESERLDENGSNWNFWKTCIIPYLKGARLWGYVSGTKTKPPATDIDDLEKWEESDAQALSTILMNIAPNAQAGLDCTLAETAWNGLLNRYSQADPIAQNLAHTQLLSK